MTNKHLAKLKKRYMAEGYKLAKKKILNEYYNEDVGLWSEDEIDGEPLPSQEDVWALFHSLEGYIYNPYMQFKKRVIELEKAIDSGNVSEKQLNRMRLIVADRFQEVMNGFNGLANECEEIRIAIQ